MKRKCLLILLTLCFSAPSFACGEVKPPQQIAKLVKQLARSDFPTEADVLSIIRIESSFNPKAVNINEREHSNGLMQVQNGPMDPKENITAGIKLLRTYYNRFHSKEAAIKSYNVGPENYARKIYMISAQEYYDKFALQRIIYSRWPKTGKLHTLGESLGCKQQNVLPNSKTAKRRAAKLRQSTKS
jgi:hypothetical protein